MRHHPVHPHADPRDIERVTDVFRALSDPTRLQLMQILTHGETRVVDLVVALGQPQSTVSHHLTLLRTVHLVQTGREATSVYYRLADVHMAEVLTQAFSHAQHERLGLPDHTRPDPLIGRVH